MANLRDLAFGVRFDKIDTSPIDKANKSMDNLKESMKKTGKNMASVGKKLSKKLTLPIVGVGVAALKVTANFDDAMANVQKISGATGEDFDNLRDKAKELGSTTAYSASEAADGMGILAASGMETNDILAVSKDMFDLMSAGSIEANTAASILTNTMAQFGLEASDSSYIVDTFAATSAKAKVSVDDLEYMMSQAGATLASMNMDVHESTAAFGHLANAGLPVKQLGTTVNAMGREIKANADQFKSIGVDVYDPVTGKLKDMGSVMSDVEKAVQGKTDAERDSILQTVFSGQAMQGATAWINQGSEAYAELTDEIIKESKAAETMAAIQEDTIGGAFRAMKSAAEGFMIEVGDVLKKPIQQVAKTITGITSKFGELSGPTKKIIIAIAGIVAAIGPVLFIGGKLIGVMAAIASPVGILIAGLAGLAAILVHLWRTNEEFRDGVIEVWNIIRTKMGEVIESIKELWATHGEAIMTKISETMTTIGEIIMAGIQWLSEFWAEHGEAIKTKVMETFTTVAEVIGTVLETIWEIITVVVTAITEFWAAHGDTIMSIASTAWGLISGLISAAMTVIQGVINVVLGIIQGDWERVWTGIQGIFEGVMDGISAAWNFVKELLGKAIKGAVNAITDKFHTAMDSVKEKWESIKKFLKNPIKGTVNLAQKGVSKVKGWFGHKTGAYNIPYDDYPAMLHKNEMVLTASASDKYRAMGGTENDVPTATATTKTPTSNKGSSGMQVNFSPSYNIEVKGTMNEREAGDLLSEIDRQTKRSIESFFHNLQLQMG